ncbi:hypothetical protein [Bacillus tuaregi]|uniref:hypothetical protein n=1 Tax=Bacillus tuaregi TaxID=1816695 RepID=UPI0008F8A085|nr:hypothetical protein [Bacillus tuaregi]
MKVLKMLLIALFFVFSLSYVAVGSNVVSADDDYEEDYENHDEEEKEEIYEELGETLGWASVIAMVAAGLLFPFRKSAKWIVIHYPRLKTHYISIVKFFGKYHLAIGIIAFAVTIFHGVTMYLSEGKLGDDGIIGLGSGILMVIAGIIGFFLFKNKKVKILRTTHMILFAFALLIGVVHIIAS